MYNLYLVLEGVVNGKILLNIFPNLKSCVVSVRGVASSWPPTVPSGTDIQLLCEKVTQVLS